MRVRWTPTAAALARRYLRDQEGMRSIGAAVAFLPTTRTRRKRFTEADTTGCVGQYRVMYVVDGDVITIDRVDRVADR